MLDFYTADTPNGRKVHLALEEMQLPYKRHPIQLSKMEQKTPEFLKMNPNGKIPVLVDSEARVTVFESAAILIHLAEKSRQFLPPIGHRERNVVMQWTMFQMASLGPNFGNYHQFRKNIRPYSLPGVERFTQESQRLLHVLENRLSESSFLAADYSIADMCTLPWIVAVQQMEPAWFEKTPNLNRWSKELLARPAAQKVFAKNH